MNTKTPLFYFCRILFFLDYFSIFIQAIVTRCWFRGVGAGIAPSFPELEKAPFYGTVTDDRALYELL